ncbi:hypothetical protein E2562_039343 [Oryza meyeriana var. granulata]|uniref:Uncharacterized protein n=1 Tax=Oryza meyeriana var. granulata TaxID=110450 RepID=A0A6G1FGW6_9ORYZ|nr:hypothetical protein E2562_039343 [Oryza meyeriana var. granulata]
MPGASAAARLQPSSSFAVPSPKSPSRYSKSTLASAPTPPPPRASRRRHCCVSARGCRRRFGIDVVASVDAAA